MKTLITNGIRITVESAYQTDHSRPRLLKHYFSYQVTIENTCPYDVQLLSRFWRITDAYGETRTVEGDGVVGEQPILSPNQSHRYISGCPLPTPIGKMTGHYTFRREVDDSLFQADIPAFKLVAPFVEN
jgi:ApaG protein